MRLGYLTPRLQPHRPASRIAPRRPRANPSCKLAAGQPFVTQPTSPTSASFSNSLASLLLDLIRAVAALLVCIGHWRYLFFVDYPQLPTHHRSLWAIPYAFCTLGHQAVILFFVMSGYLVGGHVLRAVRLGTWSWSRYALQRLTRLWIVLLPALLLGGLLDFAALHFHVAPGLYTGRVPNHITYDIHQTLTATAFFGNALFLQSIRVPVFGSNSPLWSLANEFWYYVLFPLGLFAFLPRYRPLIRILLGLATVLLLLALGSPIRGPFPIWLFGLVLALLPTPRISATARWIATLLYWPFFILVNRGGILGPLSPDLVLGLITALYLYVLLGASSPAGTRRFTRPARTGAAFSYTLYLVHIPLLMLLTGLLAGETRWLPTPAHLAVAFACLFAAILYAYAVASLTEFRTGPVRQWLEARLLQRRPASDRSLERARS